MTDFRTPQKRVEYPELFFPPDKVVPPNVTLPSYASTAGASVTTMCFGYNDASSHLCGHAGELFAVPPPGGPSTSFKGPAPVTPAPTPSYPPWVNQCVACVW